MSAQKQNKASNDYIFVAFGAILRDLRNEAGLSQGEVATAVGLDSRIAVSQIEIGRRRIASEDLPLWADLLNVDRKAFAKVALYHFDPPAYAMIFGFEEPAPLRQR